MGVGAGATPVPQHHWPRGTCSEVASINGLAAGVDGRRVGVGDMLCIASASERDTDSLAQPRPAVRRSSSPQQL